MGTLTSITTHCSPLPGLAPQPRIGDDASEAMAFLGQRYSLGPKHLAQPAPSLDQLRQAVSVALRAPDHRQLQPFRFVWVSERKRVRLARLFAADAARRGHDYNGIERARERAKNGPALIAVVARIRSNVEDVPLHEQWVTVGAGIMNFLNALHLMGYGSKLLSGASVRDPDIQSAFCHSGETLVTWVVTGTPTRLAGPKQVVEHPEALSEWE